MCKLEFRALYGVCVIGRLDCYASVSHVRRMLHLCESAPCPSVASSSSHTHTLSPPPPPHLCCTRFTARFALTSPAASLSAAASGTASTTALAFSAVFGAALFPRLFPRDLVGTAGSVKTSEEAESAVLLPVTLRPFTARDLERRQRSEAGTSLARCLREGVGAGERGTAEGVSTACEGGFAFLGLALAFDLLFDEARLAAFGCSTASAAVSLSEPSVSADTALLLLLLLKLKCRFADLSADFRG